MQVTEIGGHKYFREMQQLFSSSPMAVPFSRWYFSFRFTSSNTYSFCKFRKKVKLSTSSALYCVVLRKILDRMIILQTKIIINPIN